METDDFYQVERRGQVAWIFLNRPEKKNAMHAPAWRDLPGLVAGLENDPQVRVLVLAGRGPCFSAGIDLQLMLSELPELHDPAQLGGVKWRLLPRIRALQETVSCLARCRKPVLAAVHGFCLGAGLDLVSACDFRLCAADAVFSLKEAAIGFVADVGVLQRLPLIIGQGMTRELAFTARHINAERARQILLVNEICASSEELFIRAQEVAEEIASNSPLAVQASKEVLNQAIDGTVAAGLRYVASVSAAIIPSGDLHEAVQAFAQRRPARFADQ